MTGEERDLETGYIVNGIGTPNEWVTGIQAAFVQHGEAAYLAHEARRERVIGVNDRGSIFEQPSESTAVVTSQGSYMLRTGPGIVRVPGARVGRLHLERKAWGSRVYAPKRAIDPVSFDDLVSSLRGGAPKRFTGIYMYVRVADRTVISAVRYLNYPAAGMLSGYLQPMTGRVLWHDGEWRLAYVAAHSTDGEDWRIEICKAGFVNNISGRPWGTRSEWLERARKLPLVGPLITTHDFALVETHAGHVQFFRYEEPAASTAMTASQPNDGEQ